MTKDYWMARTQGSLAMVLVAVLAIGGAAFVETAQTETGETHRAEKLAAARTAELAQQEIKRERLRRGLPIDPVTDPAQSGMIGQVLSPVTSNNGHLPAKQTSVNPNFAAVVVDLLVDAGVEEGDVVAVGFSGSFPAINVSVCAALETLKVRPVVISSASASQWGANQPELLWVDMEKTLYDRRIVSHRSAAASLGGIDDQGIGLSPEGIEMLREGIERNGLPLIEPEDFQDSVQQRMDIYRRQAAGKPIAAYVNVGGGTVSVGTKQGKEYFEPGLNRSLPVGSPPHDSVMGRFAADGVPVIHLSHIDTLAGRYGLPQQPAETPRAGAGEVYSLQTYNRPLAAGMLAVVLVAMYAPLWFRRRVRSAPSKESPAMAEARRDRSIEQVNGHARSNGRELRPVELNGRSKLNGRGVVHAPRADHDVRLSESMKEVLL